MEVEPFLREALEALIVSKSNATKILGARMEDGFKEGNYRY